MAKDDDIDIRRETVELLLEIVARDKYPSTTMMGMIEQLANPEERGVYASILMDNIRSDTYPSIPMMRRLVALG